MAYLLQNTLTYTIPLLIVALAGIFAERSGIINLALEGIMILGAFIGVLVVYSFQKAGLFVKDQGQMLMWVALGISAVAGAVFSLLLAFASINLKADQTIGGTALNMLAPALVLFLINIIINQNTLGMFTGDASSWFMLKKSDFGLGDVPVGELNLFQSVFMHKIYPTTFICIILFIILSVILYKTKFGLRLRACGENPQAADSLGINVYKMRYAGVVISGALAGIGGFVYALTTANCASTGDVAGFGFLALAVMIFGNWKPLSTAGAAFVFSLCKCIAAGYSSIDINGDKIYALKDLGDQLKAAGIDPGSLFRILPFLITLIVLAFTSKNSRAPKAEGIPYDKGSR